MDKMDKLNSEEMTCNNLSGMELRHDHIGNVSW